jgi:ferrous iron transport protein B
VFFNGSALVATSAYFLAMLSTAFFGSILKRIKVFNSNCDEFLLEIPPLRLPSIKDVFMVLWEKVKDFTIKAGMIVFIVSVGLWTLQNVGVNGYTYGEVEKSFLFAIGDLLKYIFYPLGFFNWQTSVAFLSGIFAKEAVVETLILTTNDVSSLFNNVFSGYAFMAFVLLSPPCMASLVTAKTELASKKWFVGMLFFQFISAYFVAFLINAIGFLLTMRFGLLLSMIIGIMVISLTVIFVKRLKKVKCKDCTRCAKGGKKCQAQKRYTI